jgi:hypothetical protein
MKETDMLTIKIDLLMKRLKERAQDKEAMKGTVQAIDSYMTCEVCGNVGHLENDCPKPVKKLLTSTTGFVSHKVTTGGTTNRTRKVI